MASMPIRAARAAAAAKAWRMRTRPAASSACGASLPGVKGKAEGAHVRQPPSPDGRSCPPSQGGTVDALRPACASCTAIGMAECRRTCASVDASACSFSSDHRPRSCAEMRPSASTAVASMISMPAPESASWPRCIRCQDVALPSCAEYWHIGAITIRLGSVSVPSSMGAKRVLMGWQSSSCPVLDGQIMIPNIATRRERGGRPSLPCNSPHPPHFWS